LKNEGTKDSPARRIRNLFPDFRVSGKMLDTPPTKKAKLDITDSLKVSTAGGHSPTKPSSKSPTLNIDVINNNPLKWSVTQVCDFVKSLPGCSDYVEDFQLQVRSGSVFLFSFFTSLKTIGDLFFTSLFFSHSENYVLLKLPFIFICLLFEGSVISSSEKKTKKFLGSLPQPPCDRNIFFFDVTNNFYVNAFYVKSSL
jgi:hypothetical protein